MSNPKSGVVYILTNESMPGYIKIGYTTDINTRLKSLDRTGTPLPFEVYYAAEVEDMMKEELWLHSIFEDRRVRSNREFFKMNPEHAAIALKRVALKEKEVEIFTTSVEREEIKEIKERRARFHFKNYNIPVGAELIFTRNPAIVARVAHDDKIIVDGVTDSLSSTAHRLLGYKRQPQGTQYFMYNGEILDELRRRIEEE